MILRGIIDCDFTNYKLPVLTLEFPYCTFKCDKLNGRPVCQNSNLIAEPIIEISYEFIWQLYEQNPLTKGFCCQGLEPLDSIDQLLDFIDFIRKRTSDPIIIYTGYDKNESEVFIKKIECLYKNIIIKWGRYITNHPSHYDEVLGVFLASDNQYAEYLT